MGESAFPSELEEKLSTWQEVYSVGALEELTASELRSKALLYENEVDRTKAEYNRGRLVTPTLAQIYGLEPWTHEELRRFRRKIETEATKIRMNFARAEGRIEKQGYERKQNRLKAIEGILDSAGEFVLVLLHLLRKIVFWK
ncbi:hypothetical protein ACFPYI_05545 [Halomarina salina]|uniref:Uncharacterized protein n=1 Tax=Halomarina salina TaxID=1872699 RepID=A0ABD5RK98_9EURY|nr:hypothetical protein [Halomarina salina]